MVSWNAGIQFCYQGVWLKKTCTNLSSSLSTFSSIMSEYLNPVVKAYQYPQNMDSLGIAANNATDLIRNISEVSKYIRQTVLRLTIEWNHRGWSPWQNSFIGENLTKSRENAVFLEDSYPQTEKGVTALPRSREFLQYLYSQSRWKPQPVLQTAQSRSANQHHVRAQKDFWFRQ